MNNSNCYPHAPGARKGSPETAFAAAEAMRTSVLSRQTAVLQFIAQMGRYGATAHEIEKQYDWERQSAMPRISELRAAGLIDESGFTRMGKYGRRQTAWVLKYYAPSRSEMVSPMFMA